MLKRKTLSTVKIKLNDIYTALVTATPDPDPLQTWIEQVIAWSSAADPEDLGKWEDFLRRYLAFRKWNTDAIDDFWEWGLDGFNNWDLQKPSTHKEFFDEVFYCSDRMSMDRLFRCHVLYRNLDRTE